MIGWWYLFLLIAVNKWSSKYRLKNKNVFCILYSFLCTLYSVFCTPYSVTTLYSVLCILSSKILFYRINAYCRHAVIHPASVDVLTSGPREVLAELLILPEMTRYVEWPLLDVKMNAQMFLFSAALSLIFATASARSVLELQGVNFELALTSYKYAAILFYDSSSAGQTLIDLWQKATDGFDDLNDIHGDGEIAMVYQMKAYLACKTTCISFWWDLCLPDMFSRLMALIQK